MNRAGRSSWRGDGSIRRVSAYEPPTCVGAASALDSSKAHPGWRMVFAQRAILPNRLKTLVMLSGGSTVVVHYDTNVALRWSNRLLSRCGVQSSVWDGALRLGARCTVVLASTTGARRRVAESPANRRRGSFLGRPSIPRPPPSSPWEVVAQLESAAELAHNRFLSLPNMEAMRATETLAERFSSKTSRWGRAARGVSKKRKSWWTKTFRMFRGVHEVRGRVEMSTRARSPAMQVVGQWL